MQYNKKGLLGDLAYETNDAHCTLNYGVDGHIAAVDTVIWDARPAQNAGKISLQTHGFTLEKTKTGLKDQHFFDPKIVEKVYYPEMKNRIIRLMGADDVVVLGHLARNAAEADKRGLDNPFAGGGNGVNGYVSVVHTDFRMEKAYELARKLSGGNADVRDRHSRFVFINAWRNVSSKDPIYNNTLACCDGNTVESVMPCDVRLPDGKTAMQYRLSPGEAEQHRWFYFPHMQKDEVLYFIQYDSDPLSPCRYCFHTAFNDPRVDPALPQRQSVEVRAIAFFHDYMPEPPKIAPNLSGELFNTLTGGGHQPRPVAIQQGVEAPYGGVQYGGRRAMDMSYEEDEEELKKALAMSAEIAAEEEEELKRALAASAAMSGGGGAQPMQDVPMGIPVQRANNTAKALAALHPKTAKAAPPLNKELTDTVKMLAERGGQTAEAIAAMLTLDLKAVQDTLNPPAMDISEPAAPPLPPGLAENAKTMAKRGMGIELIAQMLKVEVASVEVTLAAAKPGLKRQPSVQLQNAAMRDQEAYDAAMRASLAAELGHVSREASFKMAMHL